VAAAPVQPVFSVTGAGAWLSVWSASWTAVTAQIASTAMTSTMWRKITVYRLVQARQSFPDREILLHRPAQPGRP